MPQTEILVTGALGNVGAEILNALVEAGVPVRAADPNPAAVLERFPAGIQAVPFDFQKPGTYTPALEGVRRLFLMRPPQISDVARYMFPLIDAARQAGVDQVVFLSILGVENNPRVPHYKVEQYLESSGMSYTFLRSSFFMQNLSTTHRVEIRERDEIFLPVGDARTSFIDARDIGAVGALALVGDGHVNQAYELTGEEALDYYQVADLFSEILGREITYKNPSAPRFFLGTWRRGTPFSYALIMTWLYNSTRSGMAERVTDEVGRLLGRPPVTLRQFIEDNRQVWSK